MAQQNTLEELRREHAAQFSVDAQRVALVTLDLDILNQTGTFVAIHARGTTLFETRAFSWLELGVPPDAPRASHYRPPVKYLVEPTLVKWYSSTAESERARLKRMGRQVDFMPAYWWLSYDMWTTWLEEFQATQAKWNQHRQEKLCDPDAYAGHRAWLEEQYTPSAKDAYRALLAAGASGLGTEAEFVDRVVSHALDMLPMPAQIEQLLVLDYEVPALVGPEQLNTELRRAEEARLERETERVQHDAEIAKLVLVGQVEAEIEAEERRAEMFRQRWERLQEQAHTLQSPLEQVLQQILSEVRETAEDMLGTIKEHGNLRGRAGERLRSLAERSAILHEFGYAELARVAQRAGGLTIAADGEGDAEMKARVGVLESTLEQIQQVLAAGSEAKGLTALVAQEMGTRRWKSICLKCRHTWASEGSLEPQFCTNPRCKSPEVVSRELGVREARVKGLTD
jgi:hypothetical protein